MLSRSCPLRVFSAAVVTIVFEDEKLEVSCPPAATAYPMTAVLMLGLRCSKSKTFPDPSLLPCFDQGMQKLACNYVSFTS